MRASILGIGTAVPQNRVPQDVAAKTAARLLDATPEQADRLMELFLGTNIEARHLVVATKRLEDALQSARDDSAFESDGLIPSTAERMKVYVREAFPLALEASQAALAASKVAPESITHVVSVSCTGFASPGVDVNLMQALSLPPTASRTHVGFMGCHATFNALRVAQAYVEANRSARVLLCAVELCSQHYYYPWRVDRVICNALFADGAAAMIVGPADSSPDTASDAWRVAACGSVVIPDSQDAMTWNIGDQGFEMSLSKTIPHLIEEHLKPWLEGWLRRHDLRLQDVASWAIHPGGPRILTSVETALSLTPDDTVDSRTVLRDYGNMSSTTITFILDRMRRRNAPRPCVALAFGPGLTTEAILFR